MIIFAQLKFELMIKLKDKLLIMFALWLLKKVNIKSIKLKGLWNAEIIGGLYSHLNELNQQID